MSSLDVRYRAYLPNKYCLYATNFLFLKVKPEIKLLGLYLMDSIMKNLKATTNYIQIFEKCVVFLFVKVFESVSKIKFILKK